MDTSQNSPVQRIVGVTRWVWDADELVGLGVTKSHISKGGLPRPFLAFLDNPTAH